MVDGVLQVPPAKGALLGEIRAQSRVLEETHDGEGAAHLRVRAFPDSVQRWRTLLPAPPVETAADIVALARRYGVEVADQEAEVDDSGLDFRVVHARDREDRPWVLRTPRTPGAVEAALLEAHVLRLVGPRLPVPVPDWRVHAMDLIAYPRLPGRPAVTFDADAGPRWAIPDHHAPPDRVDRSAGPRAGRVAGGAAGAGPDRGRSGEGPGTGPGGAPSGDGGDARRSATARCAPGRAGSAGWPPTRGGPGTWRWPTVTCTPGTCCWGRRAPWSASSTGPRPGSPIRRWIWR